MSFICCKNNFIFLFSGILLGLVFFFNYILSIFSKRMFRIKFCLFDFLTNTCVLSVDIFYHTPYVTSIFFSLFFTPIPKRILKKSRSNSFAAS